MDANGRTALMWAAIQQLPIVMKTLIDHLLQPVVDTPPDLGDAGKLFRMKKVGRLVG